MLHDEVRGGRSQNMWGVNLHSKFDGKLLGSKEGSHLIICIFLKDHSVVWRIYCVEEKEYASGHFR